jgi:glycosyltransferase involved in cell wall biosynthesis
MGPTLTARPPATVVYAFLDFRDGGAQRLALRTCRYLDPAAFRPRLVCLRARGPLVDAAEVAGIPVAVLGRLTRPFDAGAVLVLARWLRSVRADIIHVSLYSRAAPYARLAARLAGVPLTVAHEHCRAAPPGHLRRLVDRRLAPGTHFIAVSQADRADLLAAGIPPAAIDVVYPGIELDRFAPGDRVAARAALGLPAGRPIVLVPARLHPMKRHIDLLAAFPRLVAGVPDILVLCAGGGPLASALPALAQAAGWSDQIRFLGPRDDLPRLLAASDVVALASRAEGLPAALIEAQVAERAIVATAVGGVAEMVADGVTGRLVPPGAPEALADALIELLTDAEARGRMATRARDLAVGRFGIEAATRRLETIYSRELARRTGTPCLGHSLRPRMAAR